MHFRHISTKIQPKNLKQLFDWGDRATWATYGYALASNDPIVSSFFFELHQKAKYGL